MLQADGCVSKQVRCVLYIQVEYKYIWSQHNYCVCMRVYTKEITRLLISPHGSLCQYNVINNIIIDLSPTSHCVSP